jgi:hypothetical protein
VLTTYIKTSGNLAGIRITLFLVLTILLTGSSMLRAAVPQDLLVGTLYRDSWAVHDNLHVGDRLYGDSDLTIKTLPTAYAGMDWIQTARRDVEQSRYNVLGAFRILRPCNVYVAFDDTLPSRPAWIQYDWVDTGDDILINDGHSLSLFKKSFSAFSLVHLGRNHVSNQGTMYFVLVKATGDMPKLEPPSGKIVNVCNFDVKGDGVTLNTRAINRAIGHCARKGGGTVYFPNGVYRTGTIMLQSNVHLFLQENAVIKGSENLDDYPEIPVSFPSWSRDRYTRRCLILGKGQTNISISGPGVIDGSKYHWTESQKIRPTLLRILECTNVRISDITLRRSGFWTQHYVASNHVVVDNIKVDSRYDTGNNDGIDIDSCSDFTLTNSIISSKDDAIVLKCTSTRNCTDVTIDKCTIFGSSCAGIKLGTESHGGFQNIKVSNCTVVMARLEGLAVENVDGGSTKNVTFENIDILSAETPIFVRLGNRARTYQGLTAKKSVGSIENITFKNISYRLTGAFVQQPVACVISGIPGHPINGLHLSDLNLELVGGVKDPNAYQWQVSEVEDGYPRVRMFEGEDKVARFPAYGIWMRHVKNVSVGNINLGFKEADVRPALFFDDVSSISLAEPINVQTHDQTTPAPIWHKQKGPLSLHSNTKQ